MTWIVSSINGDQWDSSEFNDYIYQRTSLDMFGGSRLGTLWFNPSPIEAEAQATVWRDLGVEAVTFEDYDAANLYLEQIVKEASIGALRAEPTEEEEKHGQWVCKSCQHGDAHFVSVERAYSEGRGSVYTEDDGTPFFEVEDVHIRDLDWETTAFRCAWCGQETDSFQDLVIWEGG